MSDIPGPPADTPNVADSDTAKAPDYTGDHAGHRVFYVKLGWFRYGTDDKGHAAAVVLSCLLITVIVLISLFGAVTAFASQQPTWIGTVLSSLCNAFLVTAGIAIGKGRSSTKSDE